MICVAVSQKNKYDQRILSMSLRSCKWTEINSRPLLIKNSSCDFDLYLFTHPPVSYKCCYIKHWHILSTGPTFVKEFVNSPVFASKQSSNFRDKFLKSHLSSPLSPGNVPCLNCVNYDATIKATTTPKAFKESHAGPHAVCS